MCVCVCVYLVLCMLCAAYVYAARVYGGRGTVPLTLALPVRPSGPPDSTVYPTMLTVAASRSFLKTVLKLHRLVLLLTNALGSPISTRTCLLSLEEGGRKEGSGKKGNSSPTLFVPGFFFSFFLFSFEVVRHSFKPHCTPTLNTWESVMNMYQHSIWQQ